MIGTLFGVGVGPGDPELMTLKAVKCLKHCGVIAVPQSGGSRQTAYEIARLAVPEIQHKPLLILPMPMTKEVDILKKAHEKAAEMVMQVLLEQDVAFLTLGDPSIYATFSYLQKELCTKGGHFQVIPGVPSFCAAAAALQMPLTEGSEMLHIIPASYPVEAALKLSGTRVLMKSGSQYTALKETLQKQALDCNVSMVENCGMGENEHLYHSVSEMPKTAGYFSLIIIKDRN